VATQNKNSRANTRLRGYFYLWVFGINKKRFYTEGSFDFEFMMSDFGNIPTYDIENPKYTEGYLIFRKILIFNVL
jgi:hypothetical protein